MPDEWAVDGFNRAHRRIDLALADLGSVDAREISIATFEATAWAAVLIEKWRLLGDARAAALMHVRSRFLHGAAAPAFLDASSATWCWYPSENLPPVGEGFGQPHRGAYDVQLAGRPVADVFAYFASLVTHRVQQAVERSGWPTYSES
jgi:hypothetical protein